MTPTTARSQAMLLLVVSVMAVTSRLYMQAITAFRDHYLHGVDTTLLVSAIGLLTTMAAALAAIFSRRAAASRPVAVLIAAVAAVLASAILFPIAGVVWGCFVGLFVCYLAPDVAALKKLLAVSTRLVLGLSAGCGGAALARSVYIESGSVVWATPLFVIAVAVQTLSIWGWFPGRIKERRPASGGRRVLAACGLMLLFFIGAPVSWFIGWHAEVARRVHQVAAKGGYIQLAEDSVLVAVRDAVRHKELDRLTLTQLSALDWKYELIWGPDVDVAVLRDPTRADIRTLSALDGMQRLRLVGGTIDDRLLAALPSLPDVSKLEIRDTRVTGRFFADVSRLPNVAEVQVATSPFSDTGVAYLAARKMLGQVSFHRTDVTTSGLASLGHLHFWGRGNGEIPFDRQVWELFSEPEKASLKPSSGRAGPASLFFADFPLESVSAALLSDLQRMPDDLYVHLQLSSARSYEAGLLGDLEQLARVRVTRMAIEANHADRIAVIHLPRTVDAVMNNQAGWVNHALAAIRHAGMSADEHVLALLEANGDDSTELAACRRATLLGQLKPAGLPGLIDLLTDPRRSVRMHAVREISGFGPAGAAAVPRLVQALDDPDRNVLRNSVWALAGIGPGATAAKPKLIEIAETLAKMGPAAAAAVPALIEALTDPTITGPLRQAAARALGELAKDAGEAQPETILEALREAQRQTRDQQLMHAVTESLRGIEAELSVAETP